MQPMTIVEKPIHAIPGDHRPTGDGVHLVARNYRKGVRLDLEGMSLREFAHIGHRFR